MTKDVTRRQMLARCAGALPSLACLSAALPALAESPRRSLGVVIHSYPIRRAAEQNADPKTRIDDPLVFLDYCRGLGAAGVQVGLGARDQAYVDKLRRLAETSKMYLEGSIRLPRDQADVERFTAEIRTANQCGASVVRTVLLDGRRYEVFDTDAAFRQALDKAKRSLQLAKPVIEKQDVRLAVENHKDLRAAELVDLIKHLDTPHLGVCVDTGNSIALLEEPLEVVQTLAPLALTSHLKDMGVEECADGFLLSEVPLGAGFLDLPKIVEVLRRARPEIRFNIEMITRDPLRVPCLTRKYWATFDNLPGRFLADTLTMVRAHAAKKPLPRIKDLSKEAQLKLEDDNVRACLSYGKDRLGL